MYTWEGIAQSDKMEDDVCWHVCTLFVSFFLDWFLFYLFGWNMEREASRRA